MKDDDPEWRVGTDLKGGGIF